MSVSLSVFFIFFFFLFFFFFIFYRFFFFFFFFFQAEDGIRDGTVTGVQTCALPISVYFCDHRRDRAAALDKLDLVAGLDAVEEVHRHQRFDRSAHGGLVGDGIRSEERRVGKEWRYRWSPYHKKKTRMKKIQK